MTKEVIDIGLVKEGLNTVMTIKVADELETYFKTLAGNDTEQSSKWLDKNNRGLYFYKKVEAMSQKVGSVQVMDNFGNGLFDDQTGRINVALIRTVGASKGISIKTQGLMTYSEMETYIKELATWVKGFYEEQMRPAEIKAKISMEVGEK